MTNTVTLKNGSVEATIVITSTMALLRTIHQQQPMMFLNLLMLLEPDQKLPESLVSKYAAMGLVDSSGSLLASIHNILESGIVWTNKDMYEGTLGSPIA